VQYGVHSRSPVKIPAPTAKPPVYTWRKRKFNKPDVEWKDSLPPPPEDEMTPYQFFKALIDDEMLERISMETNLYAHAKEGKVVNVTKDEIEKYFGILLYMGVVSMSQYHMYWAKESRFPLIADVMSRNRFETIRRYLHFNDNANAKSRDDPAHDKLYKIRPLIDGLRLNLNCIPPEEHQSIDEQIIPFKGRSFLKQYIKNKPHKWGFKVFTRAGVSGIMYDFELYVGKGTCEDYGLGFSSDIVMMLCANLPEDLNYKIYFDNWFTSIPLLDALKKRGLWATGTIRADRTKKCPLETEKNLKRSGRGSMDWRVETNSEVICVRWFDSKAIQLVSTFCGIEPMDKCKRWNQKEKSSVEVQRPNIVQEYNQNMGGEHNFDYIEYTLSIIFRKVCANVFFFFFSGVDLADMLIELYRIPLRAKRYYMRIVSWCLNVAVTNGWLLYRRHQGQRNASVERTLIQFQCDIAAGLTLAGKSSAKKRGRPSESPASTPPVRRRLGTIPVADVRLDNLGHWPVPAQKGRCKKCKKGYSRILCQKCKVALCLTANKNCFLEFHTK
jgi:hypothetical protein